MSPGPVQEGGGFGRPQLSVSRRLALGFSAGALAHLIGQGGLSALLGAVDLRTEPAWSFEPMPPLGVPLTVNLMFWDGLWGAAYAAVEPRMARRLRLLARGLGLGAASLLVYWFVVLPLKGAGPGPGSDTAALLMQILYDAVFGVGAVAAYAAGAALLVRSRHPHTI